MGFWNAVASAGPYANSLYLTPDRWPRQHLITQFLQAMCSSWRPTNSVKVLRHTGIYLLLHPDRGAECGDEYICLCVCVFVCDQIFVQVTSGSGLVLLQQYSDML